MGRAAYPITYLEYQVGGTDEYNNDVDTWAEGVERMIFGANDPETSEDPSAGPNRTIITRKLLIPPGQTYSPRDRVVLADEPGFQYEVEGTNSDGHNPYGWNPGGTVIVRRTDG
ncbi:head-to-tail stopper [Gordonia phage Yakult]|nr:head-to-tail stopper [Gordonia phage Yakult]